MSLWTLWHKNEMCANFRILVLVKGRAYIGNKLVPTKSISEFLPTFAQQGNKNYTLLPDPNYNIKNARYQVIGGSSPTIIGLHVFDPSLLVKAKVAIELWRIQDWTSDANPMQLGSSDTIKKLIVCDFPDIGNASVTI